MQTRNGLSARRQRGKGDKVLCAPQTTATGCARDVGVEGAAVDQWQRAQRGREESVLIVITIPSSSRMMIVLPSSRAPEISVRPTIVRAITTIV